MSNEKFSELAELIEAQLDGKSDETTIQRLSELLSGDHEAQTFYVEYCQTHAMLAWEHGVLNVDAFEEFNDSSKVEIGGSSRQILVFRYTRMFAIATMLMLAIFGSWYIYHWSTQNLVPFAKPTDTGAQSDSLKVIAWKTRDILAVVSKNHGARLSVLDAALELGTGDQVRNGIYDLSDGLVELTFNNGVELIIESPASFEIESEMRMVLHGGRLSARVSELGKGFMIETPSADLVDFGTEFAIEVSHDGKGDDEFHVFQGEVVVTSKSNNARHRLELLGGQATRLDHRTSTPAGIDIDHQRFIRGFENSPQDYYDQVSELDPDVYYVMQLNGDGQTLRNEVSDQAHAKISCSDPEYFHWAPGFNGGTAFQMNGANTETYAVADDYPKSENDRLSVTAWVYAESRPWWGSIAKNWEQSPEPERRGQFHFGLFELTGVLEAHINDNDNVEQFVKDTVPFPLNRWQHVAMVADGKTLRLYRNGQEVAATPYNGLNGNPRIKALAIGNKLGDDSQSPSRPDSGFWDGCIDHLAIFNKALTPEQIQNLFETGQASMKSFQSVGKTN